MQGAGGVGRAGRGARRAVRTAEGRALVVGVGGLVVFERVRGRGGRGI